MKAATPRRVWVLGGAFLLLSLVGAFDYVMTITQNTDYFEYLGYGGRQIAYFTNYPIPLTVLWTLGVWGAVVGSILLLCRSRAAVHALGLALLSQAVLDVFTFAARNRWDVLGSRLSTQDFLILFLTLGMLLYSMSLRRKGILY
jgi:hypothetical protein